MPIYEYECTSCHHHCDLLQKFSDAPEINCPECSKPTSIKLISAAGFQLKGTGWYETDFKNKPASNNNASSKKETAGAATTDTSTAKSTSTASAETGKSSKGDSA